MGFDQSKSDAEKNSERIWLRVSPTLKAAIEAKAKADRRELAAWARMSLEKAVERKKP